VFLYFGTMLAASWLIPSLLRWGITAWRLDRYDSALTERIHALPAIHRPSAATAIGPRTTRLCRPAYDGGLRSPFPSPTARPSPV